MPKRKKQTGPKTTAGSKSPASSLDDTVKQWLAKEFAVPEKDLTPFERVERVLMSIPYREREIFKLRYGFGDGYTYTLDECARIFKISRDTVRQIEAKAI